MNEVNKKRVRRKFLTEVEVNAVLSSSREGEYGVRNYCMILLSFIHGFRASEVCQLKLSDIDLVTQSICINRIKGGFSTIQPLLPGEVDALTAWLTQREKMLGSDTEWLFLSKKGSAVSRQRFHRIISELGLDARLAIKIHPHMLRHSCDYALANLGIDTRLIQDYLGHRNIRHTVWYTASNARRFRGIWGQEKEPGKHNRP